MRVFYSEKGRDKEDLEDAARERQEGTQGQCQQEFAFREVLEQVRGYVDVGCYDQIVRKSYIAMRDDSKEEFRKNAEKREITRMDSRGNSRSL